MKAYLLLLLAPLALEAQPISIGIKGGVPITDALETFQGNNASYVTNTHRYLVGGTIQLNLPLRFSIEADGLYKRLGYQFEQFGGPGSPVTTRTVADVWEFPVLGKFAIWPGPIRPFVDAGASWRHIANIEQAGGSGTVLELNKDTTVGFVAGGGVEFKFGIMRLTPEFRYTHWGSENLHDPVNSLLRTNLNQGDFILGLTF
jgi:opacity protein-like surface antigen